MRSKGHHHRNANAPRKGASIKVEPIRHVSDIAAIKMNLSDKPRDLCLFTFGINTAYRANELLSMTIGQVAHLNPGDRLDLRQSKTATYRPIIVNRMVVKALRAWLLVHPRWDQSDAPLFTSHRNNCALRVSTVNNMVKGWCRDIGLSGNYGSHSLRKTWGYQQRVLNGQSTPILMVAFGHSSEAQTLDYLCIQQQEIANLYAMEL